MSWLPKDPKEYAWNTIKKVDFSTLKAPGKAVDRISEAIFHEI